MTILPSQSARAPVWYSDVRVVASLLVISGLLHVGHQLTIGVPEFLSEPSVRLSLSAILAWGLWRWYYWAWWASFLTAGLWLLVDFMRVSVTTALSGSIEPLYNSSEAFIAGAFMAEAVAIALLLRMRTRLRPAITLGATLLGVVIVVLGLLRIGEAAMLPGESDLGWPIQAAVAERVGTPAVKVSIGTVNGIKGVRVVIGDSILSTADSAAQVPRSEEIAALVGSLLPPETDLEFIGIGWSLDTGPGAMPALMHRFSVNELREATDTVD